MDGQQSRRTRQSYRNGYCVLLALVVLSPLLLVGAISRPAYAAGSGDLLKDVPVVDENTLNNAACAVAAATMVLDYYLPQSGPIHEAIDIAAIARYVKEDYWYDAKTNTRKPVGTTYAELQTGLEEASTAPELHFGVSLAASWHTTDETNWFSVLTSQLDAKRPIILFLADGGTLGWNWHYGHFIVVSGYTGDNSIIYHDPWDGKPHVLSKDAFATVWGTTWNGNSAWQYMTVSPTLGLGCIMPPTIKEVPTLPPGQGGGLDLSSPLIQNSIAELQKLYPYLPYYKDITLSTGVSVTINMPEKNLQVTPWTLTAEIYGINYETSPDQPDYVTMKDSFKEAAKIVFAWIKQHDADPYKIIYTWGTRAYIQEQAEMWLQC